MHRSDFPVFAVFIVMGVLGACAAAEAPTPAPAATPSPSTIAPDGGADARSDAPAPSIPTTPTREEQGEILVQERGCGRCHQSPDPGDGVLSGQSTPRPGTQAYGANLTPDRDTGIGGWSDALIVRAIRDGLDEASDPLCTTMPRYADLSDDEMDAIVAYLRALDPVHHRIPESECGGPSDDAGAPDDAGDPDGDTSDAGSCASWADPSATAACHACAGRPCQPNGCFNGWWCAKATLTCHPAPDACAP